MDWAVEKCHLLVPMLSNTGSFFFSFSKSKIVKYPEFHTVKSFQSWDPDWIDNQFFSGVVLCKTALRVSHKWWNSGSSCGSTCSFAFILPRFFMYISTNVNINLYPHVHPKASCVPYFKLFTVYLAWLSVYSVPCVLLWARPSYRGLVFHSQTQEHGVSPLLTTRSLLAFQWQKCFP